MDNRAAEIMIARVLITESRRRGRQPFAFALLEWAANHRRLAMRGGRQREMFA